MAKNNDGIPEEVMEEVNAIREGGDAAEETAEEQERAAVPKPPSRRAQREQERDERESRILAAAEEAREAAKKATEESAAYRERTARLEALLEAQVLNQRTQVQPVAPAPAEPRDEDYADRIDKHRKKGAEALAANDLAEYQRRQEKIMEIKVEQATARQPRPQAPQQQYQKPAWVQAVEAQYPEVMMHPAGLNTVAAFAQMDQSPVSPEKLKKAFDRAKDELGLKPKENLQEKRQMLSGGPTRQAARGGGGGGTGSVVKFPKGFDWRGAAKKAGMTEKEYIVSYAKSYPEDVERE